jgi:hypothetical protein
LNVLGNFIVHSWFYFWKEEKYILCFFLASEDRMVMPGIVTGIPRGVVKPVVDGIVGGVQRPKKESVIPDTMAVAAGATKLGADTFGSGLTPQGVGNLGGMKGGKKGGKK